MSYILDDLQELGIDEIVFVIGYLGDVVKEYMASAYPDIRPQYVVQEVQDGTAGAVKLAEPFVGDEMLILFVDTLFDADLSIAKDLAPEWSGVIWAKEVEDYQRFGVIVTDNDGAMTRIVEKPEYPVSKLANIGLYYIRDRELLFKGIDSALRDPPGPAGEFYLTDAFQYMVDQGSKILTAPVDGWYDCGKLDTLLGTNEHLLRTTRGWVSPTALVDEAGRKHSRTERHHRGRGQNHELLHQKLHHRPGDGGRKLGSPRFPYRRPFDGAGVQRKVERIGSFDGPGVGTHGPIWRNLAARSPAVSREAGESEGPGRSPPGPSCSCTTLPWYGFLRPLHQPR